MRIWSKVEDVEEKNIGGLREEKKENMIQRNEGQGERRPGAKVARREEKKGRGSISDNEKN